MIDDKDKKWYKQAYFAGLIGGSIGLCVGYPFDTIKTYCQIESKSFLRSTHIIYSKYGIFGYYKGLLTPLATRALVKGN